MTFQDAANRRDFTINAILQDPLSESIIDPCQGLPDLDKRELRAINADTFKDDSLRVLRAAQLSSRYRLKITDETKLLCQGTNLKDIPKERIWDEVKKLLLLSPCPSLGFGYFLELGVIEQLFPMLWELQSSLIGKNSYSVESAWNYVLSALDRGKTYVEELSEPEKISVLLSIIGTRLSDNNLIKFLDALGIYTYHGYHLRTQIITLSKLHLIPYKIFHQIQEERFATFALRRMARLTDLKLIVCLSESLRLDASEQISDWLREKSNSISQLKSPILRGDHILGMGLSQGPAVGKLIRQIYEYQIEDRVENLEDAKQLAVNLLLRKKSISDLKKFQENG